MSNLYDRCPNCMNPYDGNGAPCAYCGCDVAGYKAPANCLPPFTILQSKYMIGRVLGQGGFGITYIGYDMNLATYVAIKEYYPESISTRGLADNTLMVTAQSGKDEIYNKNLNRFVDEARNLSKFYGLPGIVSVRNFFYENGTAYIVMDYVAGDNLKKYLADNGGKLDENTVLALMKPVLESLYEIHKQGLIHRDISPDNIMFDDDGTIKLIDFGAVRGSSSETEMTYTVMLKHGYAPQEQYYTKGNQGPWTDIYSLCATMYKMLTGNVPPNCIERMSEDSYMPPSMCGVTLSPGVEAALTKGLAVNIADRYQNIGELIKGLYGKEYTFMGDGQIGVTELVDNTNSTVSSMVSSKSKLIDKKMIAIIVGALAAVILICVCVKAFFLGGDKDNIVTEDSTETTELTETTENITESTTETTATTTEEPSTATKDSYAYDGEWNDYKFMIDDQEYTLPMTYEEWTGYGWKSDAPNFVIQPGQIKEVLYYNEKMTCGVVYTNYTSEASNLENCHVIGFQFYADIHPVEVESTITLPKDVVFNTIDEEKSVDADYIRIAYGEPTDKSENEYLQQFRYFDESGSVLILRCWAGGGLCRVSYINYMSPEDAAFVSCQTVETVAMNEAYEAPGQTTDRWDDIFSIDGINYKIHCPASEFVNNGWELICESETLEPGLNYLAELKKGDVTITVTLANYTVFKLTPEQASVQDISIVSNPDSAMDFTFPGGVKMGMELSKLEELYSDCSSYASDIEDDGKEYVAYIYVPDGMISATYTLMPGDDGVYYVTGFYYIHSQVSRESDGENTDYITGTMVQ